MKLPKSFQRKLVWEKPKESVYVAEERAIDNGLDLHRVVSARMFAVVRASFGADGLHSGQNGYVVSRHAFDELRHFPTLGEAKLYVESIYELEKN